MTFDQLIALLLILPITLIGAAVGTLLFILAHKEFKRK